MTNHTRLSTETLLNLISLPIMTILGILAICATIRYGYRRREFLAALYQQLKIDSLARYLFDRRRRAERVAITSDSMLRAEDRIPSTASNAIERGSDTRPLSPLSTCCLSVLLMAEPAEIYIQGDAEAEEHSSVSLGSSPRKLGR
jgi:hypothetical protein